MGTVRMEILHLQSPIVMHPETFLYRPLITMKDQLFMLCRSKGCYAYIVYDRNNMAEVKDIIPLPEMHPISTAACSVANCLYILDWERYDDISILRTTEDDEHHFAVSPFISDMRMSNRNQTLSVTADGNLIHAWIERYQQIPVISIYNANGSIQHEIRLSRRMSGIYKIIPKSNGNLVLVSENNQWKTKLMEVDMDGTIVRQYHSSLEACIGVCNADKYGRILIAERSNRMELLDSEFNLMDFTSPQLDENKLMYQTGMHYNSDRNEIVTVVEESKERVLTIFRFTEE